MNKKEEIDFRPRDGVLLYEAAQILHDAKEEDREEISTYRFNKYFASILRHWQFFLNHVTGYSGLHHLGFMNKPFRFGEVVYQEWDPNSGTAQQNKFGVLFAADFLTHDEILSWFGKVTNLGQDPLHATLSFTAKPEKIYLKAVNRSGVQVEDLALMRRLSRLYAFLPGEFLETLSTCPTVEDTVAAMDVEYKLWNIDGNAIITAAEDVSSPSLEAEELFTNLIRSSMAAASQIKKKEEWLTRVPELVAPLKKRALAVGFTEHEINQFVAALAKETSSARIENLSRYSKKLIAAVKYTIWCLERLEFSVSLTEEQEEEMRSMTMTMNSVTAELREAGVDDEEFDFGTEVVGQGLPKFAPELAKHLTAVYGCIMTFLSRNGIEVNSPPETIFS